MSLMSHAETELELAGYTDDDTNDSTSKQLKKDVLELIKVFSNQGHSGSNASAVVRLFSILASYDCLAPLTGEDNEWNDVSEQSGYPFWQNKRHSSVFKKEDGSCIDTNAKVFIDPEGYSYTSKDSIVVITFPYQPKTEYIKS